MGHGHKPSFPTITIERQINKVHHKGEQQTISNKESEQQQQLVRVVSDKVTVVGYRTKCR